MMRVTDQRHACMICAAENRLVCS